MHAFITSSLCVAIKAMNGGYFDLCFAGAIRLEGHFNNEDM